MEMTTECHSQNSDIVRLQKVLMHIQFFSPILTSFCLVTIGASISVAPYHKK